MIIITIIIIIIIIITSVIITITYLLTYLLSYLLTAIEFSLGSSSPYASIDETNNIHKRNNTKTQYKQCKTQ